jgi:hypothetical protein
MHRSFSRDWHPGLFSIIPPGLNICRMRNHDADFLQILIKYGFRAGYFLEVAYFLL